MLGGTAKDPPLGESTIARLDWWTGLDWIGLIRTIHSCSRISYHLAILCAYGVMF